MITNGSALLMLKYKKKIFKNRKDFPSFAEICIFLYIFSMQSCVGPPPCYFFVRFYIACVANNLKASMALSETSSNDWMYL